MCLKMEILEKTLASLVAMNEKDVCVERRLATLDEKVKHITDTLQNQCAEKEVDDVPSADLSIQKEDRKRLKEKLKEAMDHQEARTAKLDRIKPDWMEYIFGICKPDGRLGKEGSR